MIEKFVEASMFAFGIGFVVGRTLSGKLKEDFQRLTDNVNKWEKDGTMKAMDQNVQAFKDQQKRWDQEKREKLRRECHFY